MTAAPRVRPDLLEEGDFPVPFGRYTLMGLLGEGGMARVFEAELQGARGFRKRSAVKVIRAAVGVQDARLTQALIHEARLGGLLHHPNVVETYDFGEERDQAWIAMEFVEGACLSQLLRGGEPLPPDVALELGAQICAGLDHAHTLRFEGQPAPLVHRDLKPSNVMVANSGLLKVLDFGIAKATHLGGNTTETGLTKGTPAYMSPEQAAGQEVDPRSDLFAVGCLLYEMLTGRRFFSGDTVYAIMMNVVRVEDLLKEPARLAEVEAAVSGASVVIRRCMRAAREDRYASAAELERAIRSLQGPVQAPGPIKNWVDACRVTMDPRFEPERPPSRSPGPPQIGPGETAEDLSLDAEPAAPSRAVGPQHVEPLPRTRTFAPRPAPLPQTPSPPAEGPLDGTLRPASVGSKPKGGRTVLIGAALGLVLTLIGAALWTHRSQELAPAAPSPSPLALIPPEALSMPTPMPTPTQATPSPIPRVTPAVASAAASAPTPVPTRVAAAPSPRPAVSTPTPRPRPRDTPAPTPSVRLRHRPPDSVVVGAPTRLRLSVDPPGACTPTLRYAPWDGGTWSSQAMSDSGDGRWEVELFLPYAVAWRSGVRYQFHCERGGRRVASWPASGAKKVPSLAR